MDKEIRDSDFVLMVCTETYYQRVMGEEARKGARVRWEGHLIYPAIRFYSIYSMSNPPGNRRCVPFFMTTLSSNINTCVDFPELSMHDVM